MFKKLVYQWVKTTACTEADHAVLTQMKNNNDA